MKRKEKKRKENSLKENKEKLDKAPKEKTPEKKEKSSEKTISDWKNLLLEGFSLEKFQKESPKENLSLEKNVDEFPKRIERETQRNYTNSQESEREKLREYSRQINAPRRSFLEERRTDFSNLGKTNTQLQKEYQFSNTELGDFFGFQEEEKYTPLRVEKFSKITKSFSQIERENFEGIKSNKNYKEI